MAQARYGQLTRWVRTKVERLFGYDWTELGEDKQNQVLEAARQAHDEAKKEHPGGKTVSHRIDTAIGKVLGVEPARPSGALGYMPSAPSLAETTKDPTPAKVDGDDKQPDTPKDKDEQKPSEPAKPQDAPKQDAKTDDPKDDGKGPRKPSK